VADLFKLQDQVVAQLANALRYEFGMAEAAKGARAQNPDAIDLAMRGWVVMPPHSMPSKDQVDAAKLKNIARPMRAYLLRAERFKGKREPARAGQESLLLALPDKPSIAVLPFQNMSGEAPCSPHTIRRHAIGGLEHAGCIVRKLQEDTARANANVRHAVRQRRRFTGRLIRPVISLLGPVIAAALRIFARLVAQAPPPLGASLIRSHCRSALKFFAGRA
jgi:hypothetical protein